MIPVGDIRQETPRRATLSLSAKGREEGREEGREGGRADQIRTTLRTDNSAYIHSAQYNANTSSRAIMNIT